MLDEGNHPQHREFTTEFLIWYDGNNDWSLRILWTDRVHFTLTGNVRTQNSVHLADANPHAVATVPLYDVKVTVWRGIAGIVVIGPYFFKEATPTWFVTCSVADSRYTAMLKNYVISELLQWNALNYIVWIQDGAPPHIAKSVRSVLKQHFSDRVISHHFPFPLPPRSIDLFPVDFRF